MMATAAPDNRDSRRGIAKMGWGWMLAAGMVILLAGVLALIAPGLTTVTVGIFVGWLLLLIGIAGIVMGVKTRRAHGRWWDILLGALSIVAGVVLLADPLVGAVSLTLAVTVWLAARGVIELTAAAARSAGRALPWLTLAGVADLLLALLLFLGFPLPAGQMVGLFVGVSLILAGVVALVSAFQLKRGTA